MEKFQLIFFKRGRLNVSGPVKYSFQGGGEEWGRGEEEEGKGWGEWGESQREQGGDEVGPCDSFSPGAHAIVGWKNA